MATSNKSRPTRRIISSFQAKAMRRRTPTEKMADWLTSYFGSIGFLITNLVVFTLWITVNTGLFPIVPAFDPYPFVLLITLVSLEAIILTTVVLMSQNRESKVATIRDELQLQVELITEKEISKALMLLSNILDKHGVKITDEELKEMLNAIDTSYIEKKLEEQILGKND